MEQEKDVRNKQKATFYYEEKFECHVIKEPKGKGFVNGFFVSDLIDEKYYWFKDRNFPEKKIRLFLCDIFDIEDYEVKQ